MMIEPPVIRMDQVDYMGLARLLQSDAPLDRETRDLIATLILALWSGRVMRDAERRSKHRRGTRAVAVATWAQAKTVDALMERYNVDQKTAMWAVLPDGTQKDLARVERTLTKLRAGDIPPTIRLMTVEREIADAAELLAETLPSGNR